MTRYYITVRDDAGERHQLAGCYEAKTPEAAILACILDSGDDRDAAASYEAWPVESESDII